MTRIRLVKPELFRHEGLFDLEMETGLPLRLAFIGLWGCCDKEGRFEWRPRALKLDILPYDVIDFARVLNALAQGGFIKHYRVADKDYGWVPSWQKHQYVKRHEPLSQLPAYKKELAIDVKQEKPVKLKTVQVTPTAFRVVH